MTEETLVVNPKYPTENGEQYAPIRSIIEEYDDAATCQYTEPFLVGGPCSADTAGGPLVDAPMPKKQRLDMHEGNCMENLSRASVGRLANGFLLLLVYSRYLLDVD